ncbi:hypothetical protein ACHQM5_018324 [Ranunculus cassubicifolius]
MAKGKVKLEWIAKKSARKATFKKRKKGLMQKTSELSMLCGVQAYVVVYGPDDPKPEVWPSGQEGKRVLARFMNMTETERKNNAMTVEGFLRNSFTKMEVQLKKEQRKSHVSEITKLMYEILAGKGPQNVVRDDLCEMLLVLEEKLKLIDERKEDLGRTIVMSPELIPASNEEIQTKMEGLGSSMVSAPQLISSRDEEISTQLTLA